MLFNASQLLDIIVFFMSSWRYDYSLDDCKGIHFYNNKRFKLSHLDKII